MKTQNTDEHAEFSHMGDPIPTIPERVTKRRRRPSLIALVTVTALLLSAFSTAYVVSAVTTFRASIGNSQLFSVGASYQFSNPQQSNGIIVPGSYVNVTLTILSGAASSTTLSLAFNATNNGVDQWSTPWIVGSCGPVPGQLTMTVGTAFDTTRSLLPQNTAYGASVPCANGGGAAATTSTLVTVSPGSNTYAFRIDASSTATPNSFSLNWFAFR